MIGVLGGTFDPPHLGHRILAVEAFETFGLTKLLWVLTASPPHKPDRVGASLQDRINMVTIAIAGEVDFELSMADIDRPPPHYAIGTIRWLKKQYPGETFIYLIGGDSLRDLPFWYESAAFLEEIEMLAVLSRPDVEVDLAVLEKDLPGLRKKVRFLEAPMVQISASDIRRRVREGRLYHHLLLPEVAGEIAAQCLYR
ncbi:MAG: nicotinate (nicotinamide) nucleotide adenylyltransferase [Anaerolineales bacterium]|nr:nicotinate (nicotinamide) nucleotide adenylyltransferase [Anaerolineales bacterium]